MNNNFFITGKTIGLRSLITSDAEGNYSSWLNDQEITQYNSHGRFPMTIESLHNYIATSNASRNMIVLAIVDKDSNEHIGNISLQNINWVDQNAEIAFLLGERKFWGRGIMKEAGDLMIQHAFKALNLHRVYCGTSSANIGMQKLAHKLGMSKEGVRVDALFNQGKYHDIVEFGILNNG